MKTRWSRDHSSRYEIHENGKIQSFAIWKEFRRNEEIKYKSSFGNN
jgi:hypothetical protein